MVRVTERVLAIEATISTLLTDNPSWSVWQDGRSKRELHHPTFLAIHTPSRRIVAVFVRPRRMYLSQLPAVDWLPAAAEAVVWHPGISVDVRTWLAAPHGEAPGAISTTRSSTP
jgi:hypothetical protein